MTRKSWNPLEILADVIEGEIFEGEPAAPVKATTDELTSATTPTTRPTTGGEKPSEGTRTRKPAASLADAFTDAGIEPVTVAPAVTATTPTTGTEGDDTN